jgi:MOSC domain-containing protein YiiM
MPPDNTSAPRIDRDRVQQWLDRIDRLDLGATGTAALLVETPEPGERAVRQSVTAVPGKGFAGDHARKSFYKGRHVPGREVSAMSLDVLRILGVDPVVVGDNLITEGFDLAALEPGDRVAVGEEVILARSKRPHQPCTVFRDRTSPEAFAVVSRERHRGALFVVYRGGTIRQGDALRRMDG